MIVLQLLSSRACQLPLLPLPLDNDGPIDRGCRASLVLQEQSIMPTEYFAPPYDLNLLLSYGRFKAGEGRHVTTTTVALLPSLPHLIHCELDVLLFPIHDNYNVMNKKK